MQPVGAVSSYGAAVRTASVPSSSQIKNHNLAAGIGRLPLGWARPDELSFSPGALLHLIRMRSAAMASANREMLQNRQVQHMLKTTALPNAERVVARDYGLRADNAPLTIILEPDMGGALGSASGHVVPGGRLDRLELRFSLSAFRPDTRSNGKNTHVENDRIVAHELAHLVMARTMDFASLPEWFAEGTAEYIAGGSERASNAVRQHGFSLFKMLNYAWQNTSAEYAAGYLAVRFLDERTESVGGIRAIMSNLAAGDSLDEAIAATGVYQNVRHLLDDLQGPDGRKWLAGLDLSGAGAKSSDHGPRVVPDTPTSKGTLDGFQERWAPLPSTAVFEAYDLWRSPWDLWRAPRGPAPTFF